MSDPPIITPRTTFNRLVAGGLQPLNTVPASAPPQAASKRVEATAATQPATAVTQPAAARKRAEATAATQSAATKRAETTAVSQQISQQRRNVQEGIHEDGPKILTDSFMEELESAERVRQTELREEAQAEEQARSEHYKDIINSDLCRVRHFSGFWASSNDEIFQTLLIFTNQKSEQGRRGNR